MARLQKNAMEMLHIAAFVKESNLIEGISREPTPDECEATFDFLNQPQLEIEHFERLVSVYSPGNRLRDRAGFDVRVGSYIAPPGGPHIRSSPLLLLQQATRARAMSPWEAHVAYEKLHPFTDGNGRSGRSLWLWMMPAAPLGFLHHFYYQTLENAP